MSYCLVHNFDTRGRLPRSDVPYTFITHDREISVLVRHLTSTHCTRLGIDIESENNLHRYGIHVCLIQLYDGKQAWLIDTLSLKSPASLAPLLENVRWTLVWFDAVSDLLAIRHSLGIKASPILDLALAARLLGKTGGLHSLTPRLESAASKERLQRANWMRRPLPRFMLEYAVADVTGLFRLADSLMHELHERGLLLTFNAQNLAIQEAERSWNPFKNYTRVPGFKHLSPKRKRSAKLLWYARELYARKRDIPPVNVASKEDLRRLVDEGLDDENAIASLLGKKGKQHAIDPILFGKSLREAERMLERENGDRTGSAPLEK